MPDDKGNMASCDVPWGDKIQHGTSITAYRDKQVEYGEPVVSETRFCNDGNLSGSYGNKECFVQAQSDQKV